MSDYRVIQLPAINMIGLSCRTSNNGDAQNEISLLWERFGNENIADLIPNIASDDVMCVYCDYEKDHTRAYTVVIGCITTSLDDIPEGLVGKELPSATYAVFPVSGDFPESLIDVWNQIWGMDLKRTYTGDFELYGENFMIQDDKELEVFIAIEPPDSKG